MTLLTVTACLALLMCAAGVYGVISYTTARRTQEFGIRMALGAAPRDVVALVFRQGFATVAAGVTIGLCVLAPLLYVLKGFLIGLDSWHLAYVSMAAALVTVTAAIACWVPARRATKIEPTAALRQE
jgi:ABC-type antimicrobial peptide transport system permease subunit